MKKNVNTLRILLGLAIVVLYGGLFGSCQKEVFNPENVRVFTIQAAGSGATYCIRVGLPENYRPESHRYASLYVLDGEQNFDFVANQCRDISEKHGVDNVVVVGIGYGQDRSIDYTPTEVSSVTGGAPEFLKFIENQLIPEIERQFQVDTSRNSRAILGHSYGGLFGAYAFSTNNEVFGNYLLLSPSLWFDTLVTLKQEKDNRSKIQDNEQLVFLGIGEAENSGRMQAPFEAFYETLRDNYSNIKLGKTREKDLDHMSSRNPNIIHSLEFYFQNRY